MTLYYEEVLRALTDFADPEIRGSAREKADADTDVLLAIFSVEEFVEKILHTVRDYVTGLRDGGHSKSVTEFKAACGGQPIEFEGVEYGGIRGERCPMQCWLPAIWAMYSTRLIAMSRPRLGE